MAGSPQPDDLTKGFAALSSRYEQAHTQRQSALKEARGEMESAFAQERQASAQTQKALDEEPPLPDAPKPNFGEGAMQWLAISAVMSGIAGALTRRHATNALNAFSGAINGYRQGKMDVFDQQYKSWQAENTKMLEESKRIYAKRQAILDDARTNIDEKAMRIKLLDAETGEATQYAMNQMDMFQKQEVLRLQIAKAEEASDKLIQAYTQNRAAFVGKYGMPPEIWQDRYQGMLGDIFKLKPAGMSNEQWAQTPQFQQMLTSETSKRGLDGSGGLTPSGLARAVSDYRITGHLPGGWSPALRTAVLNEAGKEDEQMGRTFIDDMLVRLQLKSDSASLTKLVQMKNAVQSFEQTAQGNLDQLAALGEQVDETGVPVVERWIRAGRQATGDPLVAQFNAQMAVTTPEIARITSNPNLTGVLTDHGRQQVEAFLRPDANAEQILALAPLLKADMKRRELGLLNQIELVRDQIGGKQSESASPAPVNVPFVQPGKQMGAGSAPPEAVEYLKQHPELRGDFEKKYGPGSASVLDQ